MLGRWMIDFWRGYVVVTLRGPRVPDVLNAATNRGILFWEIRQTKDGDYRLYMHREDVPLLRPIVRATKTKVRIRRKLGVPFLMWRAWRRKFFLAGALTFLVALYALTSVVWQVDVEGAEKRISPETIEQAAREIGIKRGAWIGGLPDTDILQDKLVEKIPELAWAGVRIQGTKIHIQVVEKVPGVQPAPTEPQNIVAAKQGTIREIFVHKGKAAVVRNQFVTAGQVLITGALADGRTNVHAAGKVEALVYYKSNVEIPLESTQKTFTGEAVEKQFITFWGKPIQIWGYGKIQFPKYEEQPEDKALKIGNFVFPIQYRHSVYREVKDEQITLTEAQAVERALELARANVSTKMAADGKIEEQIVLQKELKDGKLKAEVLNKVVEDIGKPTAFTPAPPAQPDPDNTKPQ